MLKIFQTVSIIVASAVIAEIAMWTFWSNNGGLISYITSALLGYASLLSFMFFGDKVEWIGKALKFLFSLLLSTLQRAMSTAIVLVVACALIATQLHTRWEKERFNVVLNIDTKTTKIPAQSKMLATNLHTLEDKTSIVDINGNSRFSIDKGSVIKLSLVLGKAHYAFQPITIDKNIFYKSLILKNAEKIKGVAETTKFTKTHVSSFTFPPSYIREFNTTATLSSQPVIATQFVKYGLPSQNNIIKKDGFIYSYNPILKIPNWTAYTIKGQSTNYDRPRSFLIEPLLKESAQASRDDYRGSGYDRGHLVSTADMRFISQKAMADASSMTVVAPQSVSLNRKTWAKIERKGREYANQGKTVGIFAGPIFKPKNNKIQLIVIGKNNVAVPTHFFRIIYIINPDSTLEVLSFIVPNSNNVKKNIEDYLVSTNEIEKLTGLDFFNTLDNTAEEKMENIAQNSVF